MFDPCEPAAVTAPGASAEQLASIDDAIAMWRADGIMQLSRGDSGAISVVFRDGAAAIYGYYEDTAATIYVNLELTDPAERAVTIAHELGHAFGLVHVAANVRPSVMNPGNLTVVPDGDDAAVLASKWGSCP